jgi:hypothetical protein
MHLTFNKRLLLIPFVIATFFVLSVPVVFGQTAVTNALYSLALNVTNTTATQKDDIGIPFTLSTASLIDDGFIAANALNSIVQKGNTDTPSMPGTNRIIVKGAAQDDGGAFTDYTAEAQSSTASDVQLLPATPAVSDAFYLGFDIPAGMATIDIDVAGAGTWAVTWEYYNGSGWTGLSDVDDRTSAFSVLGRNIVSWTIPTDWATTTVVAIEAYWVRARVSSFSSITTQPLGSLIQYETGDWWVWVESLPLDTQEQFSLFLGGPDDLVTYHELFTGADGLVTADAAALEPGSTFAIAIRGRSNYGTLGSSSCLICKSGVLTAYPSGIGEVTTTVTGASTTSLILTNMPQAGTGSTTLVIASDGVDLAMFGDGGAGMVAGDAQSITNNANNWTWGSSNALDYVDQVAYDADTGDVIHLFRAYSEWATGTSANTQAYTESVGLANAD